MVQSCGVINRSENGGASEPLPREGTGGEGRIDRAGRSIYTGSQSMAYRRDFQEVCMDRNASRRATMPIVLLYTKQIARGEQCCRLYQQSKMECTLTGN